MEPIEPNPELEELRDGPEGELEGSMGRLELGVQEEEAAACPERRSRPDCAYYMRTGRCGYGDGCRYNHPRDRGTVDGAAMTGSAQHPGFTIQPACRYFAKHRTCKYGDACKYRHQTQGGFLPPSSINISGYPLRPGEKDCLYYVRMGRCKFGLTCKFNHPELSLATLSLPTSPDYSFIQPPVATAAQQYPLVTNWEFGRGSVLPGSYMQGPYGPVLLVPGMMPDPNLNPFLATASTLVSSGRQHTTAQGESHYGLSAQISCLHPAWKVSSPKMSSSSVGLSKNETEHSLLERLDEPECQECRSTSYSELGSRCKYHQPPESSPTRNELCL